MLVEPCCLMVVDPSISAIRNALVIDGRAERSILTASGYLVVHGWLADEGHVPLTITVAQADQPIEFASSILLRTKRDDVERAKFTAGYDYGYLLFARLKEFREASWFRLSFGFADRRCVLDVIPEISTDRRLLDDVLAVLGGFQAHLGREVVLDSFMKHGGRTLLAALHEAYVRGAACIQQCVRFGTPRRGPTFQTVLFGTMTAVLFQPLLFAQAGIRYGEWCYVCNSPDSADELLRLAHLASRLHDLALRVVILSDNAGFGAANNVAAPSAAAEVVLINPDVHVMPQHAEMLNAAIEPGSFGNALRGGLLFYDDDTLMHGGMFLAEDLHVGPLVGGETRSGALLLRVEHHDKGVPFDAEDWTRPRQVPAVTGALMAFSRDHFTAIGGFSSDYLFGHYEDADLCLRWAEGGNRVEVDPRFKLVHLEGQGSKSHLPHLHGASLVNRYVFTDRVRDLAGTERAIRRDATLLSV